MLASESMEGPGVRTRRARGAGGRGWGLRERVRGVNGLAANGTDDLEARGAVEAGDGDFPRCKGVRADAQEGEGGPAAIDGAFAGGKGSGMRLEVGPRVGSAGGDRGGVLTDPALGDEDAPRGIEASIGEIAALEKGEKVFVFEFATFAGAIGAGAVGLELELHHGGAVVLDARAPIGTA